MEAKMKTYSYDEAMIIAKMQVKNEKNIPTKVLKIVHKILSGECKVLSKIYKLKK